MTYDKYKKIKNRTSGKARSSGMKNTDNYVDDPKKLQLSSNLDKDDFVTSIASASIYAEDEMKTFNPDQFRHLVTGINCMSDDFVHLCGKADQFYHQDHDERLNPGHTANQGFHIISSFRGHPDPELVHRAGVELARRLCFDKFYGKVCTHLNTDNYHNHILIGAYAIDGTHKFRDEWHLYRKIREISNEISLEYGLDIITSQNTERRSWAELFQADRIGEVKSAAKELKEDINEARKESDTFEDFLQKMKEKGWEYHRSKNTIHYRKGNISLSDVRLGNRYTESGIEETFARNRAWQLQYRYSPGCPLGMSGKELPGGLKLSTVYVPLYSRTGLRLPPVLRLLMLVKNLIQAIGDTYFDTAVMQRFPQNIAAAPASVKLRWIDEAIGICTSYGISTREQLSERLVHVGMNAKTMDYQAAKLYGAVDLMSRYVPDLKCFHELQSVMASLNIDESCFSLPLYSPEETARNRAALDPMDVRLKRRLYHAVGASKYQLRPGAYSTLSRSDAEAILSFLKDETGKRPVQLLSGRTGATCAVSGPCHENLRPDSARTSRDRQRRKKRVLNISDYPAEIRHLIHEYRNVLDITRRFGLNTSADIDAFIAQYHDLLSRADALSAESRQLSGEYRDLKRLQRLLGKIGSPAFVYGIRYDGTAEELKNSIQALGSDRYDQLLVLQSEINAGISRLKSINPQPSALYSALYMPADSEIRGLLAKLKTIWPEYFTYIDGKEINTALVTDHEVLEMLERFRGMQVLEREIDRIKTVQPGMLQNK